MAQLTAFLLLTLLIFIVLIPTSVSGKFRIRVGSASRYARRYRPPTKPIKPTKPTKPTNFFGEGGAKKFDKTTYAEYVTENMEASVDFITQLSQLPGELPTNCHECISVDANNTSCEESTTGSTINTCETSSGRPFCSTEYGILKGDRKYVRRSCNNNKCTSCKTAGFGCYTIQCELCNSDDCNNEGYMKVFHENWTGCRAKDHDVANEFVCDKTVRVEISVFLITIATLFSVLVE